jgi:hypothetical protein
MYNYKPIGSLQAGNSYLYMLKFAAAAQANDRIYLTMDSAIDAARIVGIETHVYFAGFDFDFPATVNIDGITYNVITANELNAMTLTLVDKNRRQCLSQYPFSALLNQFAAFFLAQQTKKFTKFDLDILTGESYVSFNVGTVIAAPFVAPITFYFDDK